MGKNKALSFSLFFGRIYRLYRLSVSHSSANPTTDLLSLSIKPLTPMSNINNRPRGRRDR